MNSRALTLSAHAKINLHLNIGSRRRDGYHDLQTLFQEIALHDSLTLKKTSRAFRFSLTNDTSVDLAATADNLVMKALDALRQKLRIRHGMDVHLKKKIPIGAGLGGGSSDAAAALLGGYLLWSGIPLSQKTSIDIPPFLFSLAAKLGADVPFFLRGGRAWAEGIGEKLQPLPAKPKQWLILVYPKIHVSTPLAYQLLDKARADGLKPRPFGSQKNSPALYNSFEPVVDRHYPQIKFVKKTLRAAGCKKLLMSGSGSSVFGFVESKEEGKKILTRLRSHSWDVFLTHTI